MDIEKIKKNKTTEELLEFGILNIDKPAGPTSFSVSDFVRKKIKARKTSHFGTLDPKVTGVLPIAINRACKLTGFFLGECKEYVGIMRLHDEVSLEKINETIHKKFLGKIIQLPPVKSRVKRQEREREIYDFKIIEKNGLDVLFKIYCQGGTYIRKICHDLGNELGVGAHMLELRRTKAGIFEEYQKEYPSINIYNFEKSVDEYHQGNDSTLRKFIIPGEIILKIYPAVQIKKSHMKKLWNGSPLYKKYLKNSKEETDSEKFCVFSEKVFVGVYRKTTEKEIFGRPEFVFQPINSI